MASSRALAFNADLATCQCGAPGIQHEHTAGFSASHSARTKSFAIASVFQNSWDMQSLSACSNGIWDSGSSDGTKPFTFTIAAGLKAAVIRGASAKSNSSDVGAVSLKRFSSCIFISFGPVAEDGDA
jgi:hypothetical protein